MARSARRSAKQAAEAEAAQALVLDADGLSKAAAGDQRVAAWVTRARELRLPLVVNAVTLAETIRGSGRDAAIHLLTRNARVDEVDRTLAAAAGRLLGRTRRRDTIDALVAVSAINLRKPVVVLTSDPVDLAALTEDHADVKIVGI